MLCPVYLSAQERVVRLPKAISSTLNQKFPGWMLAPVNQEVRSFFNNEMAKAHPSLIRGDFDGNGQPDYAVQIAPRKPGQRRLLIAFLRKGSHFTYRTLESESKNGDIYLSLIKKGAKRYDYEKQRSFVFAKDGIEVNWFMKAGWTYFFEGGRVQKIYTAD